VITSVKKVQVSLWKAQTKDFVLSSKRVTQPSGGKEDMEGSIFLFVFCSE
jgi:hypothetical protein